MAKKRSAYINLAARMMSNVAEWLENYGGGEFLYTSDIPEPDEKDPSKIRNFVWTLFEESYAGRNKSFGLRFSSRGTKEAATDDDTNSPQQFWMNCRRLESGQHWDVWGSRYSGPGTEWKAELVDDEIGNQIRVKKAHLLGAWHDIDVFPNINNMDDVLYWERVHTKYQKTLGSVITQGLNEGTAFAMSFVNDEIDPNRIFIDERVLDNEGCLFTPGARGLSKKDGNWYFMYCHYMEKRYAAHRYGLDINKLTTFSDGFFRKVTPIGDTLQKENYTGQWNNYVPAIVVLLDDMTLETIPFDPIEADQENSLMAQGELPEPGIEENHQKHINNHLEMISRLEFTLNEKDSLSPREAVEFETMVQIVQSHIELHKKAMELYRRKTGIDAGKRLKYPFGRQILYVGGEVAQDEAVDTGFDWRYLLHRYVMEEKDKTAWGRGVPEVLWNTNKNEDILLSRIADTALVHGNPKSYFSIEDKQNVDDPNYGINNDPSTPAFVQVPPTIRQASASQDNYQLYNAMKVNAEKQQGVNQVSYGQSPTKQASAELADSLLQQNQILLTGEPNQNLNAFVQSTMVTRLMMMRKYYTQPRIYYVDGKMAVINVSEMLSYVEQDGEKIPIPSFYVEVKEGSNLATQWQYDLNMLVSMASQPLADGMPLVPREAVLDHLAERYPKFAVGGPYYIQSQALQIGLQVMAEQQKQAEEDKKLEDSIKNKVVQKTISSVT